jgi:hypothetical protein
MEKAFESHDRPAGRCAHPHRGLDPRRTGSPSPPCFTPPSGRPQCFAGLQRLVHLYKCWIQLVELVEVVNVAQVLRAEIVGGTQSALSSPPLVAHAEHADRSASDQAGGKGGFLHQYQRVQRVAVRTKTALDEAIASRVLGGGEQGAVQ